MTNLQKRQVKICLENLDKLNSYRQRLVKRISDIGKDKNLSPWHAKRLWNMHYQVAQINLV